MVHQFGGYFLLKLSTGYFASTDHNTASVAARQNEKSFGRRSSSCSTHQITNILTFNIHNEGQTFQEVSQAYAPI